ncbi:MAG: hypothetical protein GY771_12910 [bacterium]|nr:hypothetical protein [bacterium]
MRIVNTIILVAVAFSPAFGDDAVQLTTDPSNDYSPSWSPDGSRIAYDSYVGGNYDIYTIPSTGGIPTRITTDTDSDSAPEWSPDNSTILYRSGGAVPELYKIPATGGTRVRFTYDGNSNNSPSWSSDDTKIAYFGNSVKNGAQADDAIFWVPADDGTVGPYPIVTYMDNNSPDWHPNGSNKIICSRNAWGGTYDIWWIDLSSDGDRITTEDSRDIHPAYSPYGEYVAFASDMGGNRDIWIIPATGGTPIQVTDYPGDDVWPTWSPSGDKIAFMSGRSGNSDIWVIDVSGLVNVESASLGEIKAHYATEEMKGK